MNQNINIEYTVENSLENSHVPNSKYFYDKFEDVVKFKNYNGKVINVDNLPENFIDFTYYSSVSATYTILDRDQIIDCTSGTFTVTLPTAIGIKGKQYIIINSGTGVITIDAYSTETISGVTSFDIYEGESITIISNNANWNMIC